LVTSTAYIASRSKTHYFTILTVHSVTVKVKVKGRVTPSQSYRVSLAIWDQTVLPTTRLKWTRAVIKKLMADSKPLDFIKNSLLECL